MRNRWHIRTRPLAHGVCLAEPNRWHAWWRRALLVLGLIVGASALGARPAHAQFGCSVNVTIAPCGSGKNSPFGVKDSVIFSVTNNTGYSRFVSTSISCPNSGYYSPYSDLIQSCTFSAGGTHFTSGLTMAGETMVQISVVYQMENPLIYMGEQTISAHIDGIAFNVLVSGRRFTVTPDRGMDSHLSSLCVADCFSARYTQSTVGYHSRDTARAVTLVYNGAAINPRPFLFTAVQPVRADSETGVLDLNAMIDSVGVSFRNGESDLYFTGVTPPGYPYNPKTVRLGGQIDASGYTTGLHRLTMTVTDASADSLADLFGGVSSAVSVDADLVVINGGESPVAKGWGIAGIQRVYALDDTDYVIIDGDGSYTRFAGSVKGVPSGYYTAQPTRGAADFSYLVYWGSGDSTYMRRYQNGTVIYYNAAGYMTSILDGISGLRSQYQYESWTGGQRLKKILDPYWKISGVPAAITLTYGTYGLSTVTEPGAAGRTTTFTVDASGHLTTWADPDSKSTTFGYDGANRLTSVTDRRGDVQHFYYDTAAALLDSVSGPTFPIDAGGGTTTNGTPVTRFKPWQPVGVPKTATYGSPAAPLDTTRKALVKGPLGDSTQYVIDMWGQALTTTDPVGQVTSATRVTRPYYYYSKYGNAYVDTVATPFSSTIKHPDQTTDSYWYAFDWGGVKMTHQSLAGMSDVYYVYYNNDRWVDSIGGSGAQPTRYYYSGTNATRGLPDSVRTYTMIYYGGDSIPTSAAQHVTYDATYHRPTSSQDAVGNTTSYTYDATFGNLSQTTQPGSRTTTVTFDSHGRDSLAHVPGFANIRTTYDAMDRVTASTVLTGTPVVTTYQYDALYDTAVVDGRGTRYSITSDALGHATKEYAGNSTTSYRSYRYDLKGRLTSTTNRRGQIIALKYDALDRLTSRTGTGIADSLAYKQLLLGQQQLVTWNPIVRDTIVGDQSTAERTGLSTVTRFTGASSYDFRLVQSAYDNWTYQDSIVATSSALGSYLPTVTYTKTPWIFGGSTIAIGGTDHVDRYFDLKQRLTSVNFDATILTVSGYTSGNRPVAWTFSTTAMDTMFRMAYAYDTANRVTAVQQRLGQLQRQFKYDSLGRLTAVAYRTQSCATWPGTPDANYGWLNTCVPTADSTRSYSYDAVGNRTDQANSYSASNALLHFGKWKFAYDSDGNVLTKTDTTTGHAWHYGWDALSRLSWVKESGGGSGDSVHFDYDVQGHVVQRATNGAIDRHWLYVGDQLMGVLDGSYARLQEYTYYPGTDQPHAVVAVGTGVEHDIIQDELGNVLGAEQGGTTVQQRVEYDAWGKPTYRVNNSGNELLWKGLRYESGSVGLYYVRNRWYDPDIGRFISEDPSGLQGGINLYAFGYNDPINFSDPTGLCPPADWNFFNCGDQAATYWANVANNSSGATAVGANIAGGFASLGASDTWYKTAGVLAGGFIGNVLTAGAGLQLLNQQAIYRSWYRATFADAEGSATYHLAEHGEGRTLQEYTKDALNFFQENKGQFESIRLRDGTPGLRLRTRGGPGGIFTPDGQIVSFWYH